MTPSWMELLVIEACMLRHALFIHVLPKNF